MIQSGRASLVVLSTETDPAAIPGMLALTPTRVEHKGTGRVRENHVWSLDVDSLDDTGDDQTGTRALRALLMRSGAAFGRVTNMPARLRCPDLVVAGFRRRSALDDGAAYLSG